MTRCRNCEVCMYLSRLKLDISKRKTMLAMASPNLFHGAVEKAFTGERKRNLWRIDTLRGCPYLLILSPDRPDLRDAAMQFGFVAPQIDAEIRDYSPLLNRIENSSHWHFRLAANPVKSLANKKRGELHAHITPYYQKQWLLERAEKHGFLLREDEFDVVHSQWYSFLKNGQRMTLFMAVFEGGLTVADADLFRNTLTGGIGHGKAYGMGLLTVVR